MKINNKYKY